MVQKFDKDRVKLCQSRPTQYFDKQNFDELIVGFMGETLRLKS